MKTCILCSVTGVKAYNTEARSEKKSTDGCLHIRHDLFLIGKTHGPDILQQQNLLNPQLSFKTFNYNMQHLGM